MSADLHENKNILNTQWRVSLFMRRVYLFMRKTQHKIYNIKNTFRSEQFKVFL